LNNEITIKEPLCKKFRTGWLYLLITQKERLNIERNILYRRKQREMVSFLRAL